MEVEYRTYRPVWPVYAVALFWLIFTLVHPLYRASDYVTAILLSAVVFIVSKAIWPTIEVPVTEEEETPPEEAEETQAENPATPFGIEPEPPAPESEKEPAPEPGPPAEPEPAPAEAEAGEKVRAGGAAMTAFLSRMKPRAKPKAGPEAEAEPEPSPTSEQRQEPRPEPKPERTTDPKPAAKPEPEPEPKPEPKPVPEPEPEPDVDAVAAAWTEPEPPVSVPAISPEAAALMEEKDRAILAMRRLNQSLQDDTVARQIDQLELSAIQIMDRVVDDESLLPQVQKFMIYYLPKTIKLLHGCVKREDPSGARAVLDAMVAAFHRQLNALHRGEVLDITADMARTEAQLARAGLS